jgi:DNA polymerase-3 subunit delta
MPFTFIAGSDDFLVKHRAVDTWETFSREVGDPHALEIIDGQAGNVDEATKAVHQFTSALQTVSMFSPEKAVWLRNLSFLADTPTGRAKGTQEAVEHLLETLGSFDDPAVRILISAAPVDRRKKAYKWLQKNGNSTFLESGKDTRALEEMLKEETAKTGKRFTGNALNVLLELTGGRAQLALGETTKLVTYLGDEGRDITPDLVLGLVPSLGESDFFEAAEAFYSLSLPYTLEAIRRHFFAGHDARPLLATLQNRNRLLIQLKALQASGKLRGRVSKSIMESLASHFGDAFGDSTRKSSFNLFTQNPYYLSRLAEVLPRLSIRQLLDFQMAFRQAFLDCVSQPNEQASVISAMAIRCLGPISQPS